MNLNDDLIQKNLVAIITTIVTVVGLMFTLYKHFSETRYKMKMSDFEQAIKYLSDDKRNELIQNPILGDLFCQTVTGFKGFRFSEINRLIQYKIGFDDLIHFKRLKKQKVIKFDEKENKYFESKKLILIHKTNRFIYGVILVVGFLIFVGLVIYLIKEFFYKQPVIIFIMGGVSIYLEIIVLKLLDRKKSFDRYQEIITTGF